jgi:hypothetical protein
MVRRRCPSLPELLGAAELRRARRALQRRRTSTAVRSARERAMASVDHSLHTGSHSDTGLVNSYCHALLC